MFYPELVNFRASRKQSQARLGYAEAMPRMDEIMFSMRQKGIWRNL